jgi:hypothetical protein
VDTFGLVGNSGGIHCPMAAMMTSCTFIARSVAGQEGAIARLLPEEHDALSWPVVKQTDYLLICAVI